LSKRKQNRQLQRPGQSQIQTVVTSHQQQLRIAPLPTPEELAHFDQVVPGLAERMIFAFIIMMSALGGGFFLVNQGKDVAGIAAIITAIGVPLGTFVWGRVRPQQPR